MGLVFPLVTRGNAKGHLLFGASWRGAAPASTRGHRDASKLSARGHAQVGTSPAALPSFLINVRKKKKKNTGYNKNEIDEQPSSLSRTRVQRLARRHLSNNPEIGKRKKKRN